MNINNDLNNIKKCNGVQPGKESFAPTVLARKLVEDWDCFVQLFDWGWDSHVQGHDTAGNLGFRKNVQR